MTIGGRPVMGPASACPRADATSTGASLGGFGNATDEDVSRAESPPRCAARDWGAVVRRTCRGLPGAADAGGPMARNVNARRVLGQSKSVLQGGDRRGCEMIDFWRYNVAFARQVLSEQAGTGAGTWKQMETGRSRASSSPIPRSIQSIAGNLRPRPRARERLVVEAVADQQPRARNTHAASRRRAAAGRDQHGERGGPGGVPGGALHPDLAGITSRLDRHVPATCGTVAGTSARSATTRLSGRPAARTS